MGDTDNTKDVIFSQQPCSNVDIFYQAIHPTKYESSGKQKSATILSFWSWVNEDTIHEEHLMYTTIRKDKARYVVHVS